MNWSFGFFGCVVLFGAVIPCARAHGQDIPAGFNVERYATLWARNPFTLEIAAAPEVRHSAFEKLSLTSWLIDGGKESIFVEDSETKEVQRIGSKPNQRGMRLIAMHLNLNPRLVEAVIADDKEQGTVKFRYDGPPSTVNQSPAQANPQAPAHRWANLPATQNSNHVSKLYPGLPHVRSEGGSGPRGMRVPGFGRKANVPDPVSAPSRSQQN
ncbi:MAG: hypothetical protein JO279_14280 [Verrucomicrobia bacterium]|nr:hypothetical protein [Verrucomicrobiota bacterium]